MATLDPAAGRSTTAPGEEKERRPRRTPGIDASPDVVEEGAPDLPKPAEYQQTLIKSFTTGGIGLHSGEYAYVRVRPAFAGEGRYFVRVPPGTNSHLFQVDKPAAIPLSEMGGDGQAVDPEVESLKIQLFQLYLEAQEEKGFSGTFTDYVDQSDMEGKAEVIKSMGSKILKGQWPHGPAEPIVTRTEADPGAKTLWWPAVAEVVPEGLMPFQQRLVALKSPPPPPPPDGDGGLLHQGGEVEETPDKPPEGGEEGEGQTLYGVESLLSALEALGVDNARIEVEGGWEVPVVDGSAMGWALDIQFAGLRPAPAPGTPEDTPLEQIDLVPRLALRPQRPIVVRDGVSFVMLMPEDTMRITVGIDHAREAPIIGKQWFSWCLYEDLHYRYELAGARQYMESPEEVVHLRELGYMRGGSEGCVIIGHKERWWDPSMLRFVDNEPVRHAMVDLIGDLALNAAPGHSGLPVGHVVAYKPNHELNARFVRALHEATSEADWVPMMDLPALAKYSQEREDALAQRGEPLEEEEEVVQEDAAAATATAGAAEAEGTAGAGAATTGAAADEGAAGAAAQS